VKRSTKRILTTHVGSLPRPADLLEMNNAKVSGRPVDQAAWTARVKTAILEVVHRQLDSGVILSMMESFQSQAGRAT